MIRLKNKRIRCYIYLVVWIIASMTSSYAQGIFNVSPDTLTWSANDLTPKQFDITCRGAWQADVTACQGLYQLSLTSGYDMCFVTVTPLSVNTLTTDRHVAVVITRSNGATVTLHLFHQGVPPPEQDPWDGVADDLTSNRNWIQRTTVTSAGGSSYFRDVEWYNGLGYRDQITQVGASTNGRSIITPVVYDQMRRDDAKVYLPFAGVIPSGIYDGNALPDQTAYYAASYNDTRPFSEKTYESSTSGRPVSFQREGDGWDAGEGHRVAFNYRLNTADDAVPGFVILPGTDYADYEGNWPAGSLFCTETMDEEGSVSRIFTDGFGKTILTEQETGVTLLSGEKEKARTLYVYDLRDSLTLVVQPDGVAALASLPGNASWDLSLTAGSGTNGTITDQYCFIWKYDWLGNLLSEHVPGGGTVEYAYDSRNREVLRTDSRMSPAGGGAYKMILTSYDQYDRPTHQFYASCNVSISTMRSLVGNGPSSTLPTAASSHLTPIRPLRIVEYFPFTSFSYPTTGNYAYVAENGYASSPETQRVKGLLKQETLYGAPDVDGSLPTGTPYLTRAYHYDSKGRVIQTVERWSDSWTRRVSIAYSFSGDIMSVKETVTPPGSTTHVMNTQYTRDERGRILSCNRILDGQPLRPVTYAYDELGRLSSKHAGTGNFLNTTLQYDIHGWQNLISLTSGATTTVFQETLRYASPSRTSVTSRYDGNPAEISYLHKVSGGTDTHTWGYEYDMMNRLHHAAHFVGSSMTASLTDTERDIVYDLNGNIKYLKRYGASGLANDLSFTLSGNRMTSLTDAQASGSNAGAKAYTYDANGNLTYDGRQDLEIRWNVLNLVSSAVTHDDGSLTFARLSDGTLFVQQKVDGTNTTVKRYCGSFIFASGTGITTPQVESVAWDEGRVFRDSSTGTYRDCWFAGDHLGDVRSIVDISMNVNSPVVLEQNDYLPFGTKIANPLHAQMGTNRWRYAGKEEFPEMQLLDFGARMYDPFTARWTAVDPLGRHSLGEGLYVYCMENPISIIDPSGRIPIETLWDIGNVVYDIGSAVYYHIKGDHITARSHWADLALDAGAVCLPYVPAGARKIIKGGEAGITVLDKTHDVKKTQTIIENAAQGREFEKSVGKTLGDKTASQVTVEVADGTRTRVDFIENIEGEIKLIEAKSSKTAPLTKNQKAAFPQIKTSGGKILGKKGAEIGIPSGTMIPPTKVDVIRPEDLLKLK